MATLFKTETQYLKEPILSQMERPMRTLSLVLVQQSKTQF